MIRKILSNTNENTTISISQKFLELNKASATGQYCKSVTLLATCSTVAVEYSYLGLVYIRKDFGFHNSSIFVCLW